MKKLRLAGALCTGALSLCSHQAAAININFDYTYDTLGFFTTQAKNVLNSAGAFFEALLTDDLTAITSSGSNSFDADFNRPDTGAGTTINSFSVVADTLTVFAGGRSLGGSTLGIGGPGGFGVSGTSAFVTNAVTRGETPTTSGVQGTTATDFAPWGGSITFDTGGTSWYFDPDTSTTEPFAGNDFFSVALHELGHLLGFGTADSWANLVSGSDFTGAASTGVFGGNVPLETDTVHWENGTTGLVNGVSQEAAMDPSILVGSRKEFTDLDLAAMTDVGWEVQAIPVPAAIWLFASGMMGLVITAKRRS